MKEKLNTKKGSVLILALMAIAVFLVLAISFIYIANQHLLAQQREANRQTAFYRAERGVNAVVNLLMRDPDDDFRTAGEKKPPAFPNTVPYAFNFQNVNFQVERLDENNNPVSKQILKETGTPFTDELFETTVDSIWIKVTGYYYPRDEYDYDKINSGDTDYMNEIIRRTIICRLSKFPMDVFDHSFFTCSSMTAVGNPEVSGPVWVGGTVDNQITLQDTANSTIGNSDTDTIEDCSHILENLKAWGEAICADEQTIDIPPGKVAGNPVYEAGNTYCCEGDIEFTGTPSFEDYSDENGNGIYDEGIDKAPPILVVTGKCELQGASGFHGLLLSFGDMQTDFQGSADSTGTVVSLSDIYLQGAGGLQLSYFDYGNWGYANNISTSRWREAYEKFYAERNGTVYTIEVEDIPVPVTQNPVEY